MKKYCITDNKILIIIFFVFNTITYGQSSVGVGIGIGAKNKKYGFQNELLYRSLNEYIQFSFVYRFGLMYDFQFSSKSKLSLETNFVTRDIEYKDYIIYDFNGDPYANYTKDFLRFIDVSLGYNQIVHHRKSFSIYVKTAPFVSIPVDFRSQYTPVNNGVEENYFKPHFSSEKQYGITIEPNIKLSPWRNSTSFYIGASNQFFWLKESSLDPYYNISLILGVQSSIKTN